MTTKGKIKPEVYDSEQVDIASLRTHPRNYKRHPEDQLAHIAESIKQHGFYRNVVITTDGTILAGHGVVEAAKRLGLTKVPVFRLSLTPEDPRALKVLAGDNELPKMAETDSRLLTDMLREISLDDIGLLGTGYDTQSLAAMLIVTRPAEEIPDLPAAVDWMAMPGTAPEASESPKLLINFDNEGARAAFLEAVQIKAKQKGKTWTAKWPQKVGER